MDSMESCTYLRYQYTELPKAKTVDEIKVLLPGNLGKDQISNE